MEVVMSKKYCLVCGNSLKPKIHFKVDKFGKTRGEMAKLQIELFKTFIESLYREHPEVSEFFGQSIVDLINPMQKELDESRRK